MNVFIRFLFKNEITINCDYFILEYELPYILEFHERSLHLNHILIADELFSPHTLKQTC